ncbi:MAG: metal dependent phosphohydrolase [uncultured bacterium]|nr:MAG: metal dependent phosphohydrolase [uncultured bacterium]HBR78837.1 phosphohydrolase [Candidatus Moranbacteria bacterium]
MLKNLIYNLRVKNAIRFSIKTHEVYQKQKRKGKDIAYVTHPLTVGIILAMAGAREEVIIAGILHDTIEDSIKEKKVDEKMITTRFGKKVAQIVVSVSEDNKTLNWEERKSKARENIKKFKHNSLLVKSADVISNVTELIDDFIVCGDEAFSRFGGPKERVIANYLEVMKIILEKWPQNPLSKDLKNLSIEFKKIV